MSERVRHLISTKELKAEFVQQLFDRATKLRRMRAIVSPHERILEGETVANLFWEASTRTRISFHVAATRLGANVVNLLPKDASVVKGENLLDTIKTLRAIGCRFFVIRHPMSHEIEGLMDRIPKRTHLINGGDGTNEHPSQGLVDTFTMYELKKNLKGLKVAILGDVVRSRVVRSNLYLLELFGAECRLAGPKELLPKSPLTKNVEIVSNVDDAVRDADVVMMLRIQRERLGISLNITDEEYHKAYGIFPKRLKLAKKDAIVMHPGPINRGVEIDAEVADGPQSVILRQAENGLFMRMAIFEALRGELG